MKHLNDGKVLDAFSILDSYKDIPNFYSIRGLMRELVSDMYNAMLDLEKEINEDNPLTTISYGRILAKLGYSDKAHKILKDMPHTIKKEGHFYPLNLSILHSHYEAPIMEKLNANLFKDSLNYSYFLRGLKQRLVKNNVKSLVSNLALFELPLGDELESLTIGLNEKLLNIRGWLSPSEASILHYFASKVPKNKLIVELGSFYGRSTIALGLGSASNHNSNIIAIDPHKGIEAYNSSDSLNRLSSNLKKNNLKNVSILEKESLIAAKNHREANIGLLFIDALHDYDSVNADFWNWEKFIIQDGNILFHDAMLPGVNQFLIELLSDTNLKYQALGFRDSILILRKCNNPNTTVNIKIAIMLKEYGSFHDRWMKDDKESILWRINCYLKNFPAK